MEEIKTKEEFLIKSINNIDDAFKDMTHILKSRDKTVWKTKN